MSSGAVERSKGISRELILGLLASKVVSAYYYWKLTGEGVRTGGGFHTYPKTIRQLPVFDFQRVSETQASSLNKIESAARQLLILHQQLAAARTPHERTALERQIAATDTQIDQLVYALYGLSEDEIKIVESTADSEAQHTAESAPPVASTAKPKRAPRAKAAYAEPPPAPPHPSLTPEKAYSDAAHFYGKEESPPFRTNSPEPEPESQS